MNSEERLARYLDREMDAVERQAFEAELERDEELAARLALWQERDAAVAVDLDALLSGRPFPPSAAVEKDEKPASSVIELAAERQRREDAAGKTRRQHRWVVPGAAVAAVAVLAVFTSGQQSAPSSARLQGLELLPSGRSAPTGEGEMLSPVLTFAAADGRWCREYATSAGRRGIACRDPGGWRIEHETEDNRAQQAGPPTGYAMAGGEEDGALGEAYARLSVGDPLGPLAETRLIENGWTGPAD